MTTRIENQSSRNVSIVISKNDKTTTEHIKQGETVSLDLGTGVAKIAIDGWNGFIPTNSETPVIIKDDGVYFEGEKQPDCNCTGISWKWIIAGLIILVLSALVIKGAMSG